MRGRGIIANERGGFNHIELKEGALEDGLFVGIGFGGLGGPIHWFAGFRMFFMVGLGWTGCDGRI